MGVFSTSRFSGHLKVWESLLHFAMVLFVVEGGIGLTKKTNHSLFDYSSLVESPSASFQ